MHGSHACHAGGTLLRLRAPGYCQAVEVNERVCNVDGIDGDIDDDDVDDDVPPGRDRRSSRPKSVLGWCFGEPR